MGLPSSTVAICVIVVIANLGNMVDAPVLPAIKDYFGSSAADIALMVSAFGLGRLLMDLPAGMLTDRVSPTKLFFAGILLSAVASALSAFSTTLQQLVATRAAVGFGSALISTVSMVILVNSARPDQRGKVLALLTSANLVGSAISPVIGGYLATVFDWRAGYLFCAFTPLISFPMSRLIGVSASDKPASRPLHGKPLPRRGPAGAPLGEIAQAARTNWPAICAVYFSTFFTFFDRSSMLSPVLPLYAGVVLGMSPAVIGAVLSSRAALTIVITLPAGALGDRIGRKAVLIPGMLIMMAGNLFLLAGDSVWAFLVSVYLISLGVLANNMLSALVADLLPERLMGRGVGAYRLFCDLGNLVGPVSMGLAVDHLGFTTTSALGAVVVLPAMVACLLLVPRRTAPSSLRRSAGA